MDGVSQVDERSDWNRQLRGIQQDIDLAGLVDASTIGITALTIGYLWFLTFFFEVCAHVLPLSSVILLLSVGVMLLLYGLHRISMACLPFEGGSHDE